MKLRDKIFQTTNKDFDNIALEIFQSQYRNNKIYQRYTDSLRINPDKVDNIKKIPFLPISFFKTQAIVSSKSPILQTFESSGTTSSINSKHYLTDTDIYRESLLRGFERVYGNPKRYCFVALLPNYLERQNSSLIYMVNTLMNESKHVDNGYYLYNHDSLYKTLNRLEINKQPTILFGVSFALLDFVEHYSIKLKYTKIIETGGMKGRRKEITREELHETLCNAFGTSQIHSEYGMTELLSQAYSVRVGRYNAPAWMKVLIREVNDPFTYVKKTFSGGINVVDFANIYSCSFVETQDLGRINQDDSFSVLGRFDISDMRGCNLLINK